MWIVAVIAFLLGLAIGLALLWNNRSKTQSEKEHLQVQLATIKAKQESDQGKLQWAENAKAQMTDAFKALASDALRLNSDQIASQIGKRRVGKECLRLCRSRWSPYH